MRSLTRIVVVALLATALAAVVGTPAHARPTNCTIRAVNTSVSNESYAVCSSGTGQYRAATRCDAPWYRLDYTRYGPWVPGPGYYSWATCDRGDRAYDPVLIY